MEEDDEKLKLTIGESKSRYEDTLITRGAHLFAKKDYQKSLAVWQKIESLREHAKDVRYEELDGCARCYYHLCMYSDAHIYVERLVSLASNDGTAWLLRSQIEEKLGSSTGSISGESSTDQEAEIAVSLAHKRASMVSLLRSLLCPSPPLQAYLSLAQVYRTLQSPHVVKFLTFRAHGYIKRSRRPEMQTSFLAQLADLDAWSNGFSLGDSADIEISNAYAQDAAVVDLERRLFGEKFERVRAQLTGVAPVSQSEEDIPDVRDPSRM